MISEKTKAIMLMTTYLPGGSKSSAKPLTTSEWNRLAFWLRKKELSLLSNSFSLINPTYPSTNDQ